MNAYQDKTVVVTGGSTGMGFATAKLFADGGARVIITGRSQSRLDAALTQLGDRATAVRGDVASLSDLDTLAAPRSPARSTPCSSTPGSPGRHRSNRSPRSSSTSSSR